MEDREFVTYLIGLLELLTNRKDGDGVLPYQQSADEEALENTTIKLLNTLLEKQ